MKVVVAGASGLIGSALVESLVADGHSVVRLVRRPPSKPDEARWDPHNGTIDDRALAGADVVANFAGAGVGDHRWTESYKREIRESRVRGTALIAGALARLERPPRVFVCGSAIGFYGDTGDRAVTEDDPQGAGFLADVVRDWEAAAEPAAAAGVRVVHPRSGLVVDGNGGAWGRRIFPLFRFGLGGRLGSGKQYWSFISLRDEVAALRFLIDRDDVAGPVNVTAPNPVTNAQVTEAMGRVMRRPTFFTAPEFGIKIVLGEFSSEVLTSLRVLPAVLEDAGFTWQDPTIDDAIRTALTHP